MKLKLNEEKHYLDYTKSTQAFFTSKVMPTSLAKKFKLPIVETYSESMDPLDHLGSIRDWVNLYVDINTISYKDFPITLIR